MQGSLQSLAPAGVEQATQQLQQYLQRNLGSSLSQDSQFSIQAQFAHLYAGNPALNSRLEVTDQGVNLQGFAQDQLAAHVTLVQGRLPQMAQAVLEIALTPQVARQMHLNVGDSLYVQSPITVTLNGNTTNLTWQLRFVGLFTPKISSDPFWLGKTFNTTLLDTGNPESYVYSALVSNEGLFAALTQAAAASSSAHINEENPITLSWEYHLNVAQVDAAHLNSLASELDSIVTTLKNRTGSNAVQILNVTAPNEVLDQYLLRSSLAQIPQGVLLLLVVGMVLLFLVLMIDLLTEQRAETMAVLRSRGASRRQISSAFIVQAVLLGLPVLLIGPLLAIPSAYWLAQHLLPLADQPALSLLGGNPLALMLSLWPYALASVGVSSAAILLAFFQATKADTLALRREAARPARRPLWQRLYLDVLLLLLALSSYGYTLYMQQTTALDDQNNLLIVSPLVLVSSAFFLLAILLLFLRFFSRLTALAARLTARRGRNVGSMLALAQIARAPRQVTRILLLLTLASAFTLFSLVFTASQDQRMNDIASYEVGADFNARLSAVTPDTSPNLNASLSIPDMRTVQTTLAQQTARYQTIAGVHSATLGYMGSLFTPQSTNLTIKAVDSATFARTAIWSAQDSQQTLASLMQLLSARRASALASHVVPAIVDASTWQSLHLSTGQQFVLKLIFPSSPGNPPSTSITSVAVAMVQHIPTLSDDTGASSDQISNAGILVDYLSAVAGYAHAAPIPQILPLSQVWLRTSDDAASLAYVRSTLARDVAPGFALADRRAFIATLQHDPIAIDLSGILALGTLTPLVLAVIGGLLASWQSVRARLLSFVLLRALGTTPRQLASVLSWEQSLVSLLMFGLGISAGVLLSALVLPVLVVTSIATTTAFGTTVSSGVSLQQVLPSLTIVIPSTLGLVLGLLLLTGLVAQGLMVRSVVRASPGQTLRLNVD
jgi:ABC-type lipoprotein release transport system permease subunit